MKGHFFVYILANRRRGVLYVGVTSNLIQRLTQHKAKSVPGFTRTYGHTGLLRRVFVHCGSSGTRSNSQALAAGVEIRVD